MWLGTLSFLISDNVLGRAIFGEWRILDSRKVNSVVIMLSYYIAQYLMFTSGYKLMIRR